MAGDEPDIDQLVKNWMMARAFRISADEEHRIALGKVQRATSDLRLAEIDEKKAWEALEAVRGVKQ